MALVRHIVETMNARGHRIERIVMCGGGTRNPLLLREQADALGMPIRLVEDEDAVTLGAGLLAAVASGAFADVATAARAMVRPGRTIVPNPARRTFHDAKYGVFLTLYDQQKAMRDAMSAV